MNLSTAHLALLCYALLLLVTLGLRMLIQLIRTGRTGLKLPSSRSGTITWISESLTLLAVALGCLAPILDLLGVLRPVPWLDHPRGHAAGLVLYGVGLLALFSAQLYMGASWRVGVPEDEVPPLVTTGPFALSRNPIYAAMIPTALGILLLLPNPVALLSFLLLILGLEMQTRLVEEPYLLRVHGATYAAYASRVGRFVPLLGRLHPPPG